LNTRIKHQYQNTPHLKDVDYGRHTVITTMEDDFHFQPIKTRPIDSLTIAGEEVQIGKFRDKSRSSSTSVLDCRGIDLVSEKKFAKFLIEISVPRFPNFNITNKIKHWLSPDTGTLIENPLKLLTILDNERQKFTTDVIQSQRYTNET
jgi:hypothetical protein